MSLPRVIPVLLLRNGGLVKTVNFKKHTYVGDPINAIKIFNEKEVDELAFIDIDATSQKREPSYDFLTQIASECFMPLAYGGAVQNEIQIERLLKCGIEKVVINSAGLDRPDFLRSATFSFGSTTIVGSMDIKRNFWGNYQVYNHVKATTLDIDPVAHAQYLQGCGVGEIFLNNVDNDGMMKGYDLELVKKITSAVDLPVIACGGAGGINDIDKVINEAGASGAAAGSFFVFHGKHKAVLITYPEYQTLQDIFK